MGIILTLVLLFANVIVVLAFLSMIVYKHSLPLLSNIIKYIPIFLQWPYLIWLILFGNRLS